MCMLHKLLVSHNNPYFVFFKRYRVMMGTALNSLLNPTGFIYFCHHVYFIVLNTVTLILCFIRDL
jgi:hypothetical protein